MVTRGELKAQLDQLAIEVDRQADILEDVVNRVTLLEDEEDPPPPPPPPVSAPWFGHQDGGRGNDALDQLLATSFGTSRPVSTFARGYSGTSHPATFQVSSVKTAEAAGIGAMLNVKLPWQGLADGQYDAMIRTFYNSWPVSVYGDVTVNHEPENDGPEPAALTNPNYVAWASTNGPLWSKGVNRYIDVAAPIIRARGLDVKVGGCLMGYSWDSDRWKDWDWWNGITPTNLDQVVFCVDQYAKHRRDPLRGQDITAKINMLTAAVRAVGIKYFSLFETAVDKRILGEGDAPVGTDETVAAWLTEYAIGLAKIPETRMVCHFHTPDGPASAQAQLNGIAITRWAEICMGGRRP